MLSEKRTGLLLSWWYSALSVQISAIVPQDDRDGLERLACSVLRAGTDGSSILDELVHVTVARDLVFDLFNDAFDRIDKG